MDEFATKAYGLQPLRPEDLTREVDPPVLTICYNEIQEQLSTHTGEVISSTKMIETKPRRKRKKKFGPWQPTEVEQLKVVLRLLIKQGTEIALPLSLPQLCLLRLHVPSRNRKQIEGKLRTPELKQWVNDLKMEYQASEIRRKRKLACVQDTGKKPQRALKRAEVDTPVEPSGSSWLSNLDVDRELGRRNAELDYFLAQQAPPRKEDGIKSEKDDNTSENTVTAPEKDDKTWENTPSSLATSDRVGFPDEASLGESFIDNPYLPSAVDIHLDNVRNSLDSFLAIGK